MAGEDPMALLLKATSGSSVLQHRLQRYIFIVPFGSCPTCSEFPGLGWPRTFGMKICLLPPCMGFPGFSASCLLQLHPPWPSVFQAVDGLGQVDRHAQFSIHRVSCRGKSWVRQSPEFELFQRELQLSHCSPSISQRFGHCKCHSSWAQGQYGSSSWADEVLSCWVSPKHPLSRSELNTS